MTKLTRKNFHKFLEQRGFTVKRVVHGEGFDRASYYLIDIGFFARPTWIIVCEKKEKLNDYTMRKKIYETGINASIYLRSKKTSYPVKLVILHKGDIYLHKASDIRSVEADIRLVHTQYEHDPHGVAWFPWLDFAPLEHFNEYFDYKPPVTKQEAIKKLEQSGTSTLDLFGGE